MVPPPHTKNSQPNKLFQPKPPKPVGPPTGAVDLLNLNAAPTSGFAVRPSPSSNFDLLSGFADSSNDNFAEFTTSTTAASNLNDNFAGFTANVPPKPASASLFDPFGPADTQNNLLNDWGNFNSAPPPQSTAPEPQPQKPTDFFADLGGLGGMWNSASPNKVPPTTPQHVPSGTPQHKPVTPQHQAKSPADYSRSHFEVLGDKNEPKLKPKSDDVFGDLLGSQGYTFSAKKDNAPRTINDMRKEDMATYMDPDKIKIMEWVSGNSYL